MDTKPSIFDKIPGNPGLSHLAVACAETIAKQIPGLSPQLRILMAQSAQVAANSAVPDILRKLVEEVAGQRKACNVAVSADPATPSKLAPVENCTCGSCSLIRSARKVLKAWELPEEATKPQPAIIIPDANFAHRFRRPR